MFAGENERERETEKKDKKKENKSDRPTENIEALQKNGEGCLTGFSVG